MCALRPNTQKYAEILVNLPNANDHDWWDMCPKTDEERGKGPPGTNFFFLNCSLAMIQAQVLEEVFSPKANLKPVQYNAALHTVMEQLVAWRKESLIDSAEGLQGPELLHLVILEASYFRTMYQLAAAQQMGVISFRYDLFSHVALRAQKHSQGTNSYLDASRLLFLLASPSIEILSLNRTVNRAWLAALFTVVSALAEMTGNGDQDVAQLAQIVSHEPALRTLELAAEQVEDTDLKLSVQYCRELFDNAASEWYSTQNGVEG